MAVALAGLLAQVHHIPAYRFWGHGYFCKVLLVVAEVHGKKHLETRRKHKSYRLPTLAVFAFASRPQTGPGANVQQNSLAHPGREWGGGGYPLGSCPLRSKACSSPGALGTVKPVHTEGEIKPFSDISLMGFVYQILIQFLACARRTLHADLPTNPVKVMGEIIHTHSCTDT